MASPAAARAALLRLVRYLLLGTAGSALALVLLQGLLARRLERAQITQMGGEVSFNLRLAELALERLPPSAVSRLSGLPLRVGGRPASGSDPRLALQTRRLQQELCRQLAHCPQLLPAAGEPRGAWVELFSPLEPVWLFTALPSPSRWPPDPLLLALALVAGGTASTLLFLWLEVQRPLQQLEQALGRVGLQRRPEVLAARGTGAVRRLTARFNAMVQRLDANERERATMLAGIAHDLKSPLTRLRLRLAVPLPEPADRQRSEADLDALERITGQFLLFAGGADGERPVALPLDQLLAESSAGLDPATLSLDLEPLERVVQPTALARAVGNLIDNALSHGRPPLRMVLRDEPLADQPGGQGFRIELWDRGAGIAPEQWQQALVPFQRLDEARGGLGHCGLGLAIAARVAAVHGGGLSWRRGALPDGAPGFAVVLHGRSIAPGTGSISPRGGAQG
ncbi:sensor histidine kinase [Vulcanococcus limneticus]|uniref:sensor histidine kinase n=1 Tax=Vulcanococcus limneticus TaxID=2170428 RepID=UPI000B99BE6C|nr:ATP-binding protein [Vulcanococcus limneticus]MCP9791253.1 histidine kinase [Vulcanococcus limneticus MW73D5]MCP9893283.1 histidine kinase [Vulcanococcus limneticus Candia 3F8]MCP9896700.1 histidine kinase [Vulcanococcus limneticus Candia 3B3]